MKAFVNKVTKSVVMATAENGEPFGWLKRKHGCLYDAEFGSTIRMEGKTPVEVIREN